MEAAEEAEAKPPCLSPKWSMVRKPLGQARTFLGSPKGLSRCSRSAPAPLSRHTWCTGARCTTLHFAQILLSQSQEKSATPRESGTSYVQRDDSCGAWSVGRGGASLPKSTMGGRSARGLSTFARCAPTGAAVSGIEGVGSPDHAAGSRDAPRLVSWCAQDR